MKNLKQIRSALITALVCFLALQLIMTIITPLLPLLILGLAVTVVVGFVFYRKTKL